MNMLVSVATRETSRREDWCDCYWSCLVITAQFITSETGEKTRRHNAEVSYLVWGCKAGFLVRVNKVRERQRWITLPSFPLSAVWFDHCSAFWHPTLSSFSPPFPVLYFFNHRLTIWRWYASRLPLRHAFIPPRAGFPFCPSEASLAISAEMKCWYDMKWRCTSSLYKQQAY